MRDYLAYICVIALVIPTLILFIAVSQYDMVCLREHNPYILGGEIATCILVLILGCERIYNHLRRLK